MKACDEWEVEELQELQTLLYMLRHTDLDDIYQMTEDSRRLRFSTLEVTKLIPLRKVYQQKMLDTQPNKLPTFLSGHDPDLEGSECDCFQP